MRLPSWRWWWAAAEAASSAILENGSERGCFSITRTASCADGVSQNFWMTLSMRERIIALRIAIATMKYHDDTDMITSTISTRRSIAWAAGWVTISVRK